MAWWNKGRKRGKHALVTGNDQMVERAVSRANEDLKQTIIKGKEVDRLVLLVRREFGVRS